MIAKITVLFATVVVATQAATLLNSGIWGPGLVSTGIVSPGATLLSAPIAIPSSVATSSVVSIPGAISTDQRIIGAPQLLSNGVSWNSGIISPIGLRTILKK